IILLNIQEKIILNYKAWNCNATSLNEGPEKTFVYRCNNSSPRYSVRTTMLFLYTFESFSGFHSQEISITLLLNFNMSWTELSQSAYKDI
ncbi:hypothetical protein PO069_06640, partial [Bacteroides thetaiotaomicron]|uniref:hypothetical protein n=1 Tax=Bacteroides thetaiotaomicron TaxID=818 RepID=UPI002480D916